MMKFYKVFFTLASVLIVNQLMAQPGPPPDPDVPITGIEYLIGLGALLGIKKIMKSFSEKK
jgi:hypothetical protein